MVMPMLGISVKKEKFHHRYQRVRIHGCTNTSLFLHLELSRRDTRRTRTLSVVLKQVHEDCARPGISIK